MLGWIYSCDAKYRSLLDVLTHQGEIWSGPFDFEGDLIRKHRRSCTICRHSDPNQAPKPAPKHPHRPCWASKSAIGTLERDRWEWSVRNAITTDNQWDLMTNWLLIVWQELKQELATSISGMRRKFLSANSAAARGRRTSRCLRCDIKWILVFLVIKKTFSN